MEVMIIMKNLDKDAFIIMMEQNFKGILWRTRRKELA